MNNQIINKILLISVSILYSSQQINAQEYKQLGMPVDKAKCEYVKCMENMELFNPTLHNALIRDSKQKNKSQNILQDNYLIKAKRILTGEIEAYEIKKPLDKCDYSSILKKAIVKKAKEDQKQFLTIVVPNYQLALKLLKQSTTEYENQKSATFGLKLLKSLLNYKDIIPNAYYLDRLTTRYRITQKEYYEYFEYFVNFLAEKKTYEGLFTKGEINEYGLLGNKVNLELSRKYYTIALEKVNAPNSSSLEYAMAKVKLQKLNKQIIRRK